MSIEFHNVDVIYIGFSDPQVAVIRSYGLRAASIKLRYNKPVHSFRLQRKSFTQESPRTFQFQISRSGVRCLKNVSPKIGGKSPSDFSERGELFCFLFFLFISVFHLSLLFTLIPRETIVVKYPRVTRTKLFQRVKWTRTERYRLHRVFQLRSFISLSFSFLFLFSFKTRLGGTVSQRLRSSTPDSRRGVPALWLIGLSRGVMLF